jgi:glycosyltransferase involved in cell wall biosynthesis
MKVAVMGGRKSLPLCRSFQTPAFIMKRVAHIVQKMAPGGLEVLTLDLARQSPGEHIVVSLEGDAEDLISAWPRLAQMRGQLFGMKKKPGVDYTLPLRLASLLRRQNISCVFTHHVGPLIYGGAAARLAGLRRLIHVEHDAWHSRDPHRRAVLRVAAALTRPQIVGVAEKMRAPLREIFPNSPLRIIANGVDLAKFSGARSVARRYLRIDDDALVIGSAGRLEWVKGHDVLLDALALCATRPQLLVAGDGSRRAELEAQAQRLGIADRVRFFGHCDNVARLLPAVDLYIQPSRNEGLPLAVLEAQAAGAPVVATQVGDVASAVCPDSGALVPPEDPAALAAAIDAALTGEPRPSPRSFIAARFDFRRTLDAYAQLMEA